MTTRLLLLADTHLPEGARDLPVQVWREVDEADLVLHAGDWVDVALLDALGSRARRLVGVVGNNDHGVLRERLPELAEVEVEGVRFGVVHETGQAKGRELRCEAAYPDLDVLVFGHSHIPWDRTTARPAAAQPPLADRPSPPAVLHLHDHDRARRRAGRGGAARRDRAPNRSRRSVTRR